MMNDSMTKYLEIFLKQHVGKKMKQKKKKITVTWVDISPNNFCFSTFWKKSFISFTKFIEKKSINYAVNINSLNGDGDTFF